MPISTQNHTHAQTLTPSSLMFRSILHSSSTHLKLTHIPRPTVTPISRVGTIADILDIIGPIDRILPTPAANSCCVRLLRRCIRSNNALAANSVHARIVKLGLGDDVWVWNVMLDFYAKAGLIDSCLQLFDQMPERDVVTWCTLMSALKGFEVSILFKQFLGRGLAPNHFIVSSALKGCSTSESLEVGVLVHGLVLKSGLGFDRFVEIGLVDMYAKCGVLNDALKVFYEIPVKSSVTWNAVMSGYVCNGGFLEAVKLFREMHRIGLISDVVTLRVVTNAASCLEMFEFCKGLHVYSIKIGFDRDTFVVVELVRLLAKLGKVDYMSELFKKVKRPDVSLYSLLISGFHLHGHRAEAVRLAEELLVLGSSPKQGALVSVINLCLVREEGMQVHACVLKTCHLSSLCVGNALISMYIKFGELLDAIATFRRMAVRDVVSWTAIIAGLTKNLQYREALETFLALRRTGIQLDQHSVATTVNACVGLQHVVKGMQVHTLGLKLGFEFSKYVTATLLHMYVKCGYIESACRLFLFASLLKDLILTNIMLTGYCWNFQPHKALELFNREYRAGMVADQFSFSTILGACADVKSREMGEQIHCQVAKRGFESSDVVIGNAIINMYMKSGSMTSACKFFYSLQRWNAISFEMLMTGYIQNRGAGEALRLFHQMQKSGFHATPVTFARMLRGCSDLAAIDLGKQIHASITKMGLISDLTIGTALVGMYAKSKNAEREKKAASEMPVGDVIQDVHRVETYEGSGKLQLEEVTQNWYSYEDVMDLFPVASNKIYDTFVLSHVDPNDLQFDLLAGEPLSNLQTVLLNMFDGIATREMGQISSVSENSSMKFKLMQVRGLLPDHVILVAVLSDISQTGLLNGEVKYCRTTQKSWTGPNHRATAIDMFL